MKGIEEEGSTDWARVYWSDECSAERGIGQRVRNTLHSPLEYSTQ